MRFTLHTMRRWLQAEDFSEDEIEQRLSSEADRQIDQQRDDEVTERNAESTRREAQEAAA